MAAPAHIARENGKKGGRPKGTKNPATLERERVLAELRQRTMRVAGVLFDSQLALARGQSYLYKIEKYREKVGKNYVLKKKKPKLVTEQWEIEQYLEGLVEEGNMQDPEDTYYFIVTRQPNTKAIDSLLDRTFGKAQQNIDFTSGGKAIGEILDELDDTKTTGQTEAEE